MAWRPWGWTYTDLSAVTGAPASASGVFGYAIEPAGTEFLQYVGTDGHVHELQFDGTGWQGRCWHELRPKRNPSRPIRFRCYIPMVQSASCSPAPVLQENEAQPARLCDVLL